ncbi:IS1096 element passenger TnpR family protein [Bradyrhizobium sp. CAR08]
MLQAAGRCPPEDVGGAPGYAEYLDALRDPTIRSTSTCASGGPNTSIPTSSTARRSKPPTTHCRKHGSRASRDQNRHQAPTKKGPQSYA